MKKAILLALALVMVFALAACGGKDNNTGGSDDPLNRPGETSSTPAATPDNSNPADETPAVNPDLSALIGGTGKLSDYDAATRQAMIDAAKAEGGDLEFKADGSVVYTDPDGSKTVQNPDGTWVWENEDGGQAQFGGEWPENEFTKLLPKPDFALTAASASNDSFTVAFSGVTLEQTKDYVEKVKAKGFTVDPESQDMEVAGMVTYSYTAKNADGYEILMFSMNGTSGLEITKP
jgi:predicted small lipoprotein YifL